MPKTEAELPKMIQLSLSKQEYLALFAAATLDSAMMATVLTNFPSEMQGPVFENALRHLIHLGLPEWDAFIQRIAKLDEALDIQSVIIHPH